MVAERYAVGNSSVLYERLLAHGICDWVRTHILYDQTYAKWTEEQKQKFDQSKFVLAEPKRRGVCGAFAVVVRDIARSVGLRADNMVGHARGRNNDVPDHANHTWAMFKFSNGVVLPADTSSCSVSLSEAAKMRGWIRSFWSLPIYPHEMAVFTAYRHQQNENNVAFGDPQNVTLLTRATCDAWNGWNVRALDAFEPKPLLISGFYYGQ